MAWWIPMAATAGAGLLGEVFGSDQKQTTTQNLRKFTPEEQALMQQIHKMLPGIMGSAEQGAGQRGEQIAQQLFQMLSGDINKQFDRAGGKARFQAGLGGQGPSSIMSAIGSDLERGRGRALTDAKTQTSLAGSQMGIGERQSDLQTLQSLFGGLNSIWGSRQVGGGQTTTMKNDPWGPAFGLGGMLGAMEYMKAE